MKALKDVFSEKPVNTGRQLELDLGKALPILFLPFIHCTIECCTEEQMLTGLPYTFDMIIGGPMAAPMFMFCMGATIHFSKENKAKRLLKRGLQMLLFGFLLNICRFLIPYLIGYAITGDVEQYLTPLPYHFFGDDVLQFAGLAMLALSLMIYLKLPKRAMFAIALALSVTGSFIRGVDFHNDVLNIAMGWFIGTENEAGLVISDFPFLNWLLVPVCGYIFGWYLQRVKDKKRFYLSFSPVLLAASIVYCVIGETYDIGMFAPGENAYYHMLTYDVAASLAMTLGSLGLYSAVAHVLSPKVMSFFTYISRNITAFYCIHWVFVSMFIRVFVYAAVGTQLIPYPWVLLISFVIVFLTLLMIHVYGKMKRTYKERRSGI